MSQHRPESSIANTKGDQVILDLHSYAPFEVCELQDVCAEACVIDVVSDPKNSIMLTAPTLRATRPTIAGTADLREHGVLM